MWFCGAVDSNPTPVDKKCFPYGITVSPMVLKLHPDKKQSTNANFSHDKDSDNSKLEKVLAAWKFLSKYSLNKNDHTLIRKILAYRNQSSKESETNSDSKPLWKIVSITRFSAEGKKYNRVLQP